MPAPVAAVAGKAVAKVTAKAIAKRIAASAGRAAASSLVHNAKGSIEKAYIIIGAMIAFPFILGVALSIFMSSIPMAMAEGQKPDDTAKKIALYVKLQDEIARHANGVANQKADSIQQYLRSLEPTPAPEPTPAEYPQLTPWGATPEPMKTPMKYVYQREINVSTPPWRVLMALDAIHNGQDSDKIDVNYIKDFIIRRISYDVEYGKVISHNTVTYTITVDTACRSLYEMAKEIESFNAFFSGNDKTGMADCMYEFLSYYDDDGTRLQNPFYDLGADIILNDTIVTQPGCVALPYFNQGEARWNYKDGRKITIYPPDRTISSSGCGATSVAMVIVGLTGDRSVNPLTCMNYAIKHGYYKGAGVYASLFRSIGAQYGISVSYWWPSGQRILDAIQKGHPVIAHVGVAGTHWPNGHYMVIRGITTNGRVIVNDPGSSSNTKQTWPMSEILRSAKGSFAECWLTEDAR